MANPQIGAPVRFRNGSSETGIYPGWVQGNVLVSSAAAVQGSTDATVVLPSTSVVLGSTDKRPRADITWTSYDYAGNTCNLATAKAVPQDDTLSSSFCFAIVVGGA